MSDNIADSALAARLDCFANGVSAEKREELFKIASALFEAGMDLCRDTSVVLLMDEAAESSEAAAAKLGEWKTHLLDRAQEHRLA